MGKTSVKAIEAIGVLKHLQTEDNELRDNCLEIVLDFINELLEEKLKKEGKK